MQIGAERMASTSTSTNNQSIATNTSNLHFTRVRVELDSSLQGHLTALSKLTRGIEKNLTFVDSHLRQYTPRIPSYIKDTTHFINIMKNIQLDPEDLLVTIDVSSLYTNIPHNQGIAAINRMMEETGTDTLLRMFISNLAYQVLTKNFFNFNGQLYEQTNYAIIFMHYLETNFLSNYPKQPKTWLRFIDGTIMIWQFGRLELDKFLEALNNHNHKIKFTYNIDQNEIPFLDTIVYRSQTNNIYTIMYPS